jgi:hypothetical protein
MTSTQRSNRLDGAARLDILCVPQGDAFRLYVWPSYIPKILKGCLDKNAEAYPVFVDIEELDRRMATSGLTYERRTLPNGGFNLVAEGAAATIMTQWLSRMFESSIEGLVPE